ncbi:hypothetical protein LTR08_004612 [Meristemomyces frigidus]|nr:hypothetical protein LTR08_004612 [Meristemomyces frigidus]
MADSQSKAYDESVGDDEAHAQALASNGQVSASVQVADSQYQGVYSPRMMPASHDEVPVSETQYGDQRPGVFSVTHRSDPDLANAHDEAETTAVADEQDVGAGPHALSRDSGSWFARPASPSDITPNTAFSFAKASRHLLDFSGKRKGVAADAASINTDAVPDDQLLVTEDNHQTALMPAESNQSYSQQSYVPPADEAVVKPKEKKRQMKHKRRYATAPTEPTEQYALAAPLEATDVYQTVEPAETVAEAVQDDTDYGQELRPEHQQAIPSTANDQAEMSQHEARASSPHTQLHDDLQAAALEQEQYSDAVDPEQGFRQDGEMDPQYVDAVDHEQPVPQDEAMDQQYVDIVDNEQAFEPADIMGQAPLEEPEPAPPTSPYAYQDTPHPEPVHSSVRVKQAGARRSTSNRADAGRVAKRKSKVGRRATAPTPAETIYSDQSASDVNDYLQILAYKVQQKQQSSSRKLAAKRNALEAELQPILAAKQALEEELGLVQQQNTTLAITLEQQKSKVTAYETKINRFKTFVDGLGNDVDALKKDAGITRRRGEQLAHEGEDRKAEQVALFEQLSTCAGKSAQLKDQALRACQDAQSQLQAAHFRNSYLEEQLSERVGLLAEERDRRSQLERQLATAASSDETIVRAAKRNNDAILDKLFEIHAVIENTESEEKTTDMMEKALAAVQALTSQHSANADDLASVKGMVESLSESVSGFFEAAKSTQDVERSGVVTIQAHLDDALKSLRADLEQREKLIQRNAAESESINTLQERLNSSAKDVKKAALQVSATETRESQLKEQNASLRAEIEAFQRHPPASRSSHRQPDEVRAELQAKAEALESAKAALNIKMEELRAISATNTDLEDHLQALNLRLKEAETKFTNSEKEKAAMESDFENRREDLVKNSRETSTRDKSNHANQIKTLTHAKVTLEKQVRPIRDELAITKETNHQLQKKLKPIEEELITTKKALQELQQQVESLKDALANTKAARKEFEDQSSATTDEKQRELQDQKALVQAKEQEVAGLLTTLKKLQGDTVPLQTHNALLTQHSVLSTQLSTEKSKLQKLQDQKALVQAKEQEVAGLLTTLEKLRNDTVSLQIHNALVTQHSALSTQLSTEKISLQKLLDENTAEKAKSQGLSDENAASAQKAEDAENARKKARSAEEKVRTELAENATAFQRMQSQLGGAKEAADRAEARVKYYQQTCESSVNEEKKRGERNLEALQRLLDEKAVELQTQADKDAAFRADIDVAWRDEQANNKRAFDKAKTDVSEAQKQREDAVAEQERLRRELDDLSRKQAEALRHQLEQLEQRLSSQKPPSRGSNMSGTRIHVPTLQEGMTPTANNKENEPPKPRKKVDRSGNADVQTLPLPAPEVLRRPGSRASDTVPKEINAHGPVVEESQFQDIFPGPPAHLMTAERQPAPFGFFSSSEDMLDSASMRSKQPPQVVQETQHNDTLPSFAAFNNSMASSQVVRPKASSSLSSVPSLQGALSQLGTVYPFTASQKSHSGHDTHASQFTSNDFTIYEDSQLVKNSLGTQNTENRGVLQDSVRLTQAEKNKYTFRKTYPDPNTASKLVHREEDVYGAKRRRSGSGVSREEVQTPTVRGEGRDSASRGMHPPNANQTQASHSSSPDFIRDAATTRKTHTYHNTPGASGSAKRRLSRKNSGPSADPRLAKREAPAAPKRKAEGGHIVEGYEHERKKRLTKTSATAAVETSRYSLRANSNNQPSINDLPSMNSLSQRSGSSSQVGGAAPKSRMRTLAGTSSRTRQGHKKMSQSDEYNARFDQELR